MRILTTPSPSIWRTTASSASSTALPSHTDGNHPTAFVLSGPQFESAAFPMVVRRHVHDPQSQRILHGRIDRDREICACGKSGS